ncbi:bis(5'-nucleosyl)-tetraphosphatase [asymmetrical] [Atheta coriaria]|uniref:bis(5'-nucleosyl)-tetraphosphatase [asymmetrical] n=1 Tax=Dalotia coriaria TaxID=877792 RepID=UPI0031F4500A
MAAGKVAAGFVIFRRFHSKVEYLLLQTSYGINHWTPPKGHVDPGETEWETALRETVEESGLVESDLKFYKDCKKVLNYPVNGKPKKVIYWLAELVNKNALVKLSDEHQAFEWLPFDKACEYGSFKDIVDTFKEFDTYITNNCA